MIYSFRGMVPVVHPSAFVHPQATLIGHVTVGEDCYVGPHAVLRGDWGKIVLKRGVNVQEGVCASHVPRHNGPVGGERPHWARCDGSWRPTSERTVWSA